MASLQYPVLFKCNPLLFKQSPPIFLLFTTSIFKAPFWSWTFFTVREAFPLSDRQIKFDTIILHVRHNLSIQFSEDNIWFKISLDASFTKLLMPTCKIMPVDNYWWLQIQKFLNMQILTLQPKKYKLLRKMLSKQDSILLQIDNLED